jgi:DNA-binding NarL/FixJ family response regulator
VIVVPAPPSSSRQEGSAAVETVEALVIDRQPLFLAALARLLEAPPLAARVVTTARSDVGLQMVRAGGINLLFCELRAEPISGLELIRALAEDGPVVPVVLLGDEGDEAQLAAALAGDVAGAFTKSCAWDELLAGVRAVVSGHRAIGSGLLVSLLERPVGSSKADARPITGQLSPTELSILVMIAQAQPIPAIAASRGISHKTVRNHLAKIYRKLELHGRTEAMLWAARMGLVES